MKATGGLRVALLGSAALSFFVGTLLSQGKGTQPQCASVAISFALKTGDSFKQPVSDLTLKLQPMASTGLASTGWIFSLVDTKDRDFIYPVNPALRFNGSQTLGAGYGVTAKQSLSYGRELRFLLKGSEYDVFWPYVEHALWPYTAPDPDDAADQYLSELDKLRTGFLRLTVVHSDVSESDEVRFAEFRMEFIAPTTYQFVPSLPSQAVACPAAMLPIKERIPARISPADPGKYRNVEDASDWNNPFLAITSDGFNLRFHGGQMHGPLSTLARTVVGLPDSAWPYGRVLAASEVGVQSIDGSGVIKRNKEEADKILKELGVTVVWWPSA
jgi:hypothetical protein